MATTRPSLGPGHRQPTTRARPLRRQRAGQLVLNAASTCSRSLANSKFPRALASRRILENFPCAIMGSLA